MNENLECLTIWKISYVALSTSAVSSRVWSVPAAVFIGQGGAWLWPFIRLAGTAGTAGGHLTQQDHYRGLLKDALFNLTFLGHIHAEQKLFRHRLTTWTNGH